MQRREPIGRNNELAFPMGTRSVSRREPICELAFPAGTGSLQLTELMDFEVGRVHTGALLVGTRPMQRTELTGFGGGRLHGHTLLAGTGSVQPMVPMGFNIGLLHGHTPLGGPRSVSRRQPTGLFASTTRGGDRATAAATNEPTARRLTRMVRIGETTTRARADILAGNHRVFHSSCIIFLKCKCDTCLTQYFCFIFVSGAAARGRGRHGGANQELSDWTN